MRPRSTQRLLTPFPPALALLAALTLGACTADPGVDGAAAGVDDAGPGGGASPSDGGPPVSEVDILAAVEATAVAGSGTATTRYLPGGDPDTPGLHIATRFTGEDRDVSIAAIAGAGYSGTGDTEHEVRIVGDQVYFRSVDLGDGWFAGSYQAPAELFVGVPEIYDPRPSPVVGLEEVVVAAGPLSEIGPDHYQGEISLGALRTVIGPPVSFGLLVDAAVDLPDDTPVLLSFVLSGGMVSRVAAEVAVPAGPAAAPDGADDLDDLDDPYGQGGYGASVTTTFDGLGLGGPVEVPGATEQLDG